MARVDIQTHALGLTWLERSGMARTAHALADDSGGVWLIDPWDDRAALEQAAALGDPAGVIQLLDRHNRDCAVIASRLNVPHHRLPAVLPGTPFTPFSVLDVPAWHEVALHWPARDALIVAEAVGTVPLFTAGRRAGVHPGLRFWPTRTALREHAAGTLLVGHGEPILSGGAAALGEALDRTHTDLPRLLVSLPKLIAQGR